MANDRNTTENLEYATVDTAPGVDGYYTNSVNIRQEKKREIYFSVRGSGVATVTIQFQCYGDTGWTDFNYDSALVSGDRLLLEGGGAGTKWRAGVANGGYSSGSLTFGFDW